MESAREISEIRHPAIKEILLCYENGYEQGVEIHCDADLPSRSGLGSSSAFVVGLLQAMEGLRGRHVSPEWLAKEAIRYEQDVLKENVGSQDQVAAAFGGLNIIHFPKDGGFSVEPLPLTAKQDGTRTVPLMRHYTDRIEQGWAYLAGVFSEQSFRADRENSFTLEGFPEDIDTCLPIFTSDFDADRAPGTRIYAARLSSGVLTFNPGDINAYDRQREAFMSAFFVRGEQSN